MHSEIYKRIRDNIIRTWPAWKRKIYNSCFAVSTHAEKLPEDDRTRSTPVWTNYDRLISKTPEELAQAFVAITTQKRPSTYTAEEFCLDDGEMSEMDWLDWLKSPVEEGK